MALLPTISLLLCITSAGLWVSSLRWEMCLGHVSMWGSGNDWRWRYRELSSSAAGIYYFSDQYDVDHPRFAQLFPEEQPGSWPHYFRVLGSGDPPNPFPNNLRPFCGAQNSGPGTDWVASGPVQVRRRHVVSGYLPYWCIVAASLPLPAMAAVRWFRRSARIKRLLCLNCGYSLTGNISGICPECGSPIRRQPEPAS